MSTLPRIRVAILGASGYIGGEALRLLVGHPLVESVAVTAASHAGQPVPKVHPNLAHLCDLTFQADVPTAELAALDAVFLALPHGEASQRVPAILAAGGSGGPHGRGPLVLDLSGDFRLKEAATHEAAYGLPFNAWAQQAAYGLTEWNRPAIREAQLIACPGCFPTGALLALTPLARAGLLDGPVVVDSKTGSSGSGIKPGEGTHHPERANDFRAYGLFSHRHQPEIAQELAKWQPGFARLVFTPHSAPMVRGIFTTAYVFPDHPVSQAELDALYADAYEGAFFVRRSAAPRCAVVAHSNFCDLSAQTEGAGTIIVTSALDNLVKGGAGQGVQNLNCAFGWPEQTGLLFPGTHP
jgi:N-acetyl-gamma-glutamyl-phosphate reductase common form